MMISDYQGNAWIRKMFRSLPYNKGKFHGLNNQRCQARGSLPIYGDNRVRGMGSSKCHKTDKVNPEVGTDLAIVRCLIEVLVKSEKALLDMVEKGQAEWKGYYKCTECGNINKEFLK